MRLLVRLCRLLPAALDRAHLEWARKHLSTHNPLHPDLPDIVRRLAELKEKSCA